MPALWRDPRGRGTVSLFTDLSLGTADLKFDDAIRAFWGSVSEPDNFHFPPFLASSNTETLKLLARSRLLPNILSRLEKLAEQANIVFVELTNVEDERRIDTEIMPSGTRQPHADLIFVSTRLIKEIIENDALDWFASLGTQQLWPTSARMKVRFPFPRVRQRRALTARTINAQSGDVDCNKPAEAECGHTLDVASAPSTGSFRNVSGAAQ